MGLKRGHAVLTENALLPIFTGRADGSDNLLNLLANFSGSFDLTLELDLAHGRRGRIVCMGKASSNNQGKLYGWVESERGSALFTVRSDIRVSDLMQAAERYFDNGEQASCAKFSAIKRRRE